MSAGHFAAEPSGVVFSDSFDTEQFVANLDELTIEEQQSVLATRGLREALIDVGQEEALQRIESGWATSRKGPTRERSRTRRSLRDPGPQYSVRV